MKTALTPTETQLLSDIVELGSMAVYVQNKTWQFKSSNKVLNSLLHKGYLKIKTAQRLPSQEAPYMPEPYQHGYYVLEPTDRVLQVIFP